MRRTGDEHHAKVSGIEPVPSAGLRSLDAYRYFYAHYSQKKKKTIKRCADKSGQHRQLTNPEER